MELTASEIQKIKKEAVTEYIKAKHVEEEAEALKEKKSPYIRGFIQLNKEIKNKMIWLMKHHKTAYCILSFLIYHMNRVNAVVASYKILQEALGISRNTITAGIKILKDYNFIQTYKIGTATAYATNTEIAWTSYGKNLKYAKLKGNILIAESEQKNTNTEKMEVIKIEPQERKRKK